uniref:Peptidase S72 domain-containing protein n=1 Tax=Globodera rostochiensis TaxID=31243 RepID=A0A914H6M4_GLORO
MNSGPKNACPGATTTTTPSSTSAHLLLLILLQPLFLVMPIQATMPAVQLRAFVGRPFTLAVAEGHAVDAEMLPRWCRFNTTARQIFGLPQLHDLGFHIISIHDGHVEVEVDEEEEDQCASDSSTIWLEIMDVRKLTNVPLEQQFQTVQALISATRKDADVRMSDLRVFPRDYLSRYRTVLEVIHKEEGMDEKDEEETDGGLMKRPDERMMLVLNISCGELSDQANDVISVAAENGFVFRVVEGVLRKNRAPIAVESTTASSTTRRTTRRVHNNERPVVLNPLKTFHCQRRLLCRLSIDDNTFVDPEDGPTSRLAISAHAIGNHTNFLMPLPGENRLEGVPLESGEYSFRLEARDRMGQANSVPFQVIVKEHTSREKPTHSYSLLLDVPLVRFLEQPQFLREFVYRLGASIHRISESEAAGESAKLARIATEIQLEELLDNGGGQTLLKWSNATLSRKICDDRQINATRDRMMHHSSERVRHDFVKTMGAKFHVRKVGVEFLGRCQTRHLLATMRVRVTSTTERNAAGQADSADGSASLISRALLIPLILILIVLLLCMIVLLLCCMQHKRGRKGGKYSDFASKSRPVVFPDEVPHREESSSADGSLATVTTPMLVEREQPPEQPPMMMSSTNDNSTNMMMTMHENPLYRAPPQAQAMLKKSPLMGQQQHEHTPQSTLPTSPRLGYQHRPLQANGQQQFSTSSTFSPPEQQQPQQQQQQAATLKHIDASPTPLRHHHNPFLRNHHLQQSMRGLTPVGQRLPPPYLAH